MFPVERNKNKVLAAICADRGRKMKAPQSGRFCGETGEFRQGSLPGIKGNKILRPKHDCRRNVKDI